MITKQISQDIIQYLKYQEHLSIDEMAYKMGISVSSMKKIINGQENFSPNNLDFYLNNNHLHLWEFILQAVPLNHLPEKIQKKVDICKNLSEKIEKNKE